MEKSLRTHLPSGKFQDVSETRSKAMAAVKSSGNKTTERRLRMALVRAGITGWVIRPRGLKGSPDFLFPSENVIIFVDGCFWHGCPGCGHIPQKNRPFWQAKIKRNRERDLLITEQLKTEGFTVLRFWEHDLGKNIEKCIETIRSVLHSTEGIAVRI